MDLENFCYEHYTMKFAWMPTGIGPVRMNWKETPFLLGY